MLPTLTVKNLTKSFGQQAVLKKACLEIFPGKVLVVIGPSGAGKSTLLRCLNLLAAPESGTIDLPDFHVCAGSVSQENIQQLRQRVGMVFQQFNLWPHKTVLENVCLPLRQVKRLSKSEALSRARGWLQKVGLQNKLNDYPLTLSGGQQQRVAIARSLAMQPEILLLDEVTSALDPELVGEVIAVIKELAQERNCAMVIVTHEMSLAKEVADEVLVMDKGEIIERGSAEKIFNYPNQERTRRFLERVLRK